MFPLWLVPYSNGALRSYDVVEDGKKCRTRCKLPNTPWLMAEAREAGLPWAIGQKQAAGSQPVLRCLAMVDKGIEDRGPLTMFSREARVQAVYHSWPADAFTLVVRRLCTLAEDAQVQVFRKNLRSEGVTHKILDPNQLLFYPHVLDDTAAMPLWEGHSVRSASDLLGDHDHDKAP